MNYLVKAKLIVDAEGWTSLIFKIKRKLVKTISERIIGKFDEAVLEEAGQIDGEQVKQVVTEISRTVLQTFLSSNHKLCLPTSDNPEVSVILVLFNRAELTLACLRSLCENFTSAMEIIVIDNASSDSTHLLLDRIQGAKIIRNNENIHFPAAVNQAARESRGKYLLLLNNDAILLPGSLESAMNTIKSASDIGAVGGKIILLDGRLQEAGSIIWQDGSCLGYGRNDNPFAPHYNFQRDVDYCSGAFLLTSRELFLSKGGFDEDYKPAYYEETDYCFKLWQMGKRVVYDPNAVILHYEFASSKNQETAIDLQKSRQKIFVAKHGSNLKEQYAPRAANILLARLRKNYDKRILFIDDRVPHYFLGSGFPRANKILKALIEIGHFVTFYSLQQLYPDAVGDTDIPIQAEIIVGESYGTLGLEEFIRQRHDYYDFILISRPHNMKIVKTKLKKYSEILKNTKVIYDAEAVVALREIEFSRLNKVQMSEREIKRMVEAEIKLASEADLILSVSEGERQKFLEYGCERVYVLGHSIAVNPTKESFEERRHILFVGAIHQDYSPNADSVVWFAENVLPEINKILGSDIKFIVAGLNKSSRVALLAGERIVITGKLDNLDAFYSASRIFVAPTRFAAGIPIKIYEAAARGIPVVSTSLLASQLGWKDGVELLVADSPEDFAKICVRLYCDSVLWENIRLNALKRVQVDCSEQMFIESLKAIF